MKRLWAVCFFVLALLLPCGVRAQQEKTVILLDPGHGGHDSGANAMSGERILAEKDCNLAIALAVKERLEATGRATVYLTRDTDVFLPLRARTDLLADCGAQLFCSIHCNSGAPDAFGCEVLVPYGAPYHAEAAARGQEIGADVARELGKAGLRVRRDQGLYKRSTDLNTYPDGSAADYYGVLYQSTLRNVPSLLVETCFLSNAGDRETFLATREGIHRLADAIAAGLAEALPAQSAPAAQRQSAEEPAALSVGDGTLTRLPRTTQSPVEIPVFLLLLLTCVLIISVLHRDSAGRGKNGPALRMQHKHH